MIKKLKIIRPWQIYKHIFIIFFEKYGDLDHSMQGSHLLELFKNSSLKMQSLKYGNYI